MLRRVLGAVLAWCLSPPAIGALYLLALTISAGSAPLVDDNEYMLGAEARAISDLVRVHFGAEIARIGVALAAAAIAAGIGIGALAGAILSIRDRVSGARRSRLGGALAALAAVAALHAGLTLHAMARSPQLYAKAWYANGGIERAVMVLATDTLGPRGVAAAGLAIVAAYLAGPPSRRPRWAAILRRAALVPGGVRVARIALFSGLAALTAGALAMTREGAPPSIAPPREAGERVNVLILAADSLRFDRLDPRVAPRLSALADRGTRFDRAYVSLPHTFPSWTTILTGRWPQRHGVRSIFPRYEERARAFDALPERLRRAGYATSVVTDFAGDSFGDIDLGWSDVDAPPFDFKQILWQRALERETPLLPIVDVWPAREAFPSMRLVSTAADPDLLADRAIASIRRAGAKPFFMTVFFSATHFPYAAPAPYYRRFTDPGYRGRFKYHKPVGFVAGGPPDAADVAQIRGLYDGAVASADAAAGRILDELARSGEASRTVVVITSDHGEMLFDEGRWIGHGDHLFGDQGTHVPLAIVDPRRAGGRREIAITRDVDLAPTIYALTGVAPPPDLDGRSLAGALDGRSPEPALAFAETDLWLGENPALPRDMRLPYPGFARLLEIDTRHGDELVVRSDVRLLTIVARHRMARDDRWKLVYAPARAGVRWMLFDTLRDPAELHDVAATSPDEVARLSRALWAWMLLDPELARDGDRLVPRGDAGAVRDPGALRPVVDAPGGTP